MSKKEEKELIAVLNEKGLKIEKKSREEVHKKGLLHREVYIYLINKFGILLSKRADNLLWDRSSGGHVLYDEEYIDAAVREFKEELGILLEKKDLLKISEIRHLTSTDLINYRDIALFFVTKDIPIDQFKINEEEINSIHYLKERNFENFFRINKISEESRNFLEQAIKLVRTGKFRFS